LKLSPTFDSDIFRHLIRSGTDALNIPINNQQIGQLLTHTDLLLRWNKKTNLTRITDIEDIAVKHFLDSMSALPYMPKTGRVLDIGSGAGFPGLVLKMMRPELEVCLIDSVRKKVSFLQHVIRTLRLENVYAHHVRAEDFKKSPSEGRGYKVVVSRALTSLSDFVKLALPFLAPEGFIAAYKGKLEEKEVEDLLCIKTPTSLNVSQKSINLPHTDINRTIVIIQPS
jgi:16S rRNA (guanine527-N7)-methyltransferase